MINKCRNCAAKLVFDPESQKLTCDRCGSKYDPEDLKVPEEDPVWDKKPHSMNEILGTDSQEYMDCYVYTCSSCGGEIIINGKEASTKCIYCGNPAVIFSRIARRKKPSFIVPFKLTREEALDNVRSALEKGFFVPEQLKDFKADDVRGIYIPYWLVNCKHHGAVVVERKSHGNKSGPCYHGRAGKMKITNLPVEASKMLADESSIRLEPFGLQAMKPFDENFLLGFYSDIPDITYEELKTVVRKRADALFDQAAMDSINTSSGKEICAEKHSTAVDYHSISCVMLPAWFITYDYNSKHNTILVNGQTGKVIGGIPWNKKLFYSLFLASGILLSGISYLVLKAFGAEMFSLEKGDPVLLMVFISIAVISMLSFGIATIRKVSRSLDLTQSGSMFNFAKKRQG